MRLAIFLPAALGAAFLLNTATPAFAADVDGDGWDSLAGDCDDGDVFIHPGAPEIVGDNTDQDCDGNEICYLDNDNDGSRTTGTLASTDLDCSDFREAVPADLLDCDDADPSVHPGAVEVCDPTDTDEDCDGLADDADTGATGRTTWYVDGDADSYGAGTSVLACDAPSGHVVTPGDCDDADPDVSPSGTEVCDGGDVDEDCDTLADDADADATGKATWYTDSDADGFGAGGGTLACDAPTGHAATDDDCDDFHSSAHPGGTEVCDAGNVDEDCDGLADDADPDATGKTTRYVDGDGDGYGAGTGTPACDASSGHVSSGGDCDDADPDVHPDATEVCTGGIDDDCDSGVDCDDSACSSEAACTTVEVFDHLECHKIKTDEKLKGVVDLDPGTNPPFAVAAGCTITKATKYCVPVMKTVVSVETTLTPNPAYVGQDLTDDRICYKVKCPKVEIPSITVEDQFGTRTFERAQATEICTPARQVP